MTCENGVGACRRWKGRRQSELELFKEPREVRLELGAFKGVRYRGFEEPELVPGVVPRPLELVCVDLFGLKEYLYGVRQLYLAALAWPGVVEGIENSWCEYVSADDGEV